MTESDDIAITAATSEDAEAIAALQTLSWQTTYRGLFPDAFLDDDMAHRFDCHWRTMLADPPERSVILAARREGRILGFIAALPTEAPETAFIDNIHIAPDAHGRGLGTKLMATCADRLTALGYRATYLKVAFENARARAFYRHLGGRESEKFLDDIAGFRVPAARFDWDDLDALSEV